MRITAGEATQEHPLPFLLKDKRGRILSWWNVQPTGDYCKDSRTGSEYALNFMASSYQRELGSDLLPIVRDMAKVGDFKNGIVCAFLCTIGNWSVDGWTPANLARARQMEAESEKSLARIGAEQAERRSATARTAALAREAKRRTRRGQHAAAD